jgi:hypothetical protein
MKCVLPWQRQHSAAGGFFQQQIGINFKEGTNKLLHLECSFVCGAEIWILRKVDHKYLGSYEM